MGSRQGQTVDDDPRGQSQVVHQSFRAHTFPCLDSTTSLPGAQAHELLPQTAGREVFPGVQVNRYSILHFVLTLRKEDSAGALSSPPPPASAADCNGF